MSDLSILHVVGSRPQFPKLAAVSRAVQSRVSSGKARIEERILHTGQHYDHELSSVFFEELQIRRPDYELGVGSGSHAEQTAGTLRGVADVLEGWRPRVVLVYGDTNATAAAAIAGVQHQLEVGHVEAGVRTGNLRQAEELNRVIADRICRWRFGCTQRSLENLEAEGLGRDSHFSGDTMLDNYRHFLPRMDRSALERFGLEPGRYILCTVHRAENTDHPDRLGAILDAILRASRELATVVFPMHPRTRKAIEGLGRSGELEAGGVKVIDSQGFNALQALLEHSRGVFTDSGGLQREAYFSGRRSVIPWEYASWIELAETGWALVGPVEVDAMLERMREAGEPQEAEESGLFGDGQAGSKIVDQLLHDTA